MAQMQNYYWVDVKNKNFMVDPATFDGKYCLCGHCYDRKGFKDRTLVSTSPIVSVKDNIATTASGSEYELFVTWCNWEALNFPLCDEKFHDLRYPEDFEEFAGHICKPKFFKKS